VALSPAFARHRRGHCQTTCADGAPSPYLHQCAEKAQAVRAVEAAGGKPAIKADSRRERQKAPSPKQRKLSGLDVL
jgi:hypothetical protein